MEDKRIIKMLLKVIMDDTFTLADTFKRLDFEGHRATLCHIRSIVLNLATKTGITMPTFCLCLECKKRPCSPCNNCKTIDDVITSCDDFQDKKSKQKETSHTDNVAEFLNGNTDII